MKWLNVIAHVCAFAYLAHGYSTSSNLIQVNDKNFKEVVIDSGKFTFVDFYADWCRHCKNLMPTIEELADLFEPYDNIQVVKINGDKDGKKMSKKYVFQGYPTLLLFHENDEPVEFDGIRDLQSLSNFVQQLSGVRLADDKKVQQKEESSIEEVQPSGNLIKLNDFNIKEKVEEVPYTIVVISATWCSFCQKLKPIIDTLANEIFINDKQKLQISVIESDKEPSDLISEKFNVKILPTILFFKGDYDKPYIYDGERELHPLLDKINAFTGLHRDNTGRLTSKAGRIPQLDLLIKEKIPKGFDGDLNSVGIELLGNLNQVGNESHEMFPYYKKLINKIINNEGEFFPSELARLRTILENDISKLSEKTIDSMQKRSNILEAFI
ncbi:protein disulfide isomerase [Scheffersomyces xylosifermentans]|uniref:protein disulfide isomerase n=1 Tax=Scheffersomyces xylosifermentans TaxID=1304137 RepID=UPI00315D0336